MAHHDRSHYLRTSMAPGLGYPIYCREALPGDQIQLEFKHLMNTQAILNPLYGSYRLQICVFFAGTSLYIPRLWRNGFMSAESRGILDVSYPVYNLSATKPITRVHESSLPAFLGLGVGYGRFASGTPTKGGYINLIPYLMYYDIFRHYYANRQEDNYPVMNASWNDPSRVRYFSLAGLDNLYLNLPLSGGSMNSNGYITNTPIAQLSHLSR